MTPTISHREWRNVLLVALAVMLLTALPYLYGASQQNAKSRFGWFMFGVDDANSYLAKMREGANGAWLFHLAYTSEPHQGALLFTPYLLMGKIAALLAPPSDPALVDAMLLVFHVARLLFGFLLILMTYRFVAAFVRAPALRLLIVVLVSLGGGLGWLLVVLGQSNLFGTSPVDLLLPEGYTFYLLYGLPHLALARIGLLGGLLALFRALNLDDPRRWLRWAALAGLCWLVMALCVPFYVAVLYAILGSWGLAALLRERRFPAGLFWRCVVGALIPAPMLVYSLIIVATDPILGTFQAQNLLPSPHPLHYVFGYGLLAVLAVPGIRWAWKRGKRQIAYLLLPAWVIAGPILVYLPVAVQRRMLEGVFVPLCILAGAGLRLVLGRRPALIRRAASLALVGLLILTPVLILASGFLALQGHDPLLFHSTDELAALDWLNAHTPADAVVLTNGPVIGNYLPARTNLRAYIGHGVETIDFGRKNAAVQRFYAGDMEPGEADTFLAKGNITYVLFGPSDPEIPIPPTWQRLYNTAGYRIYAISLQASRVL